MNYLQLVTDETPVPRHEPEALFLRPFWVVRHAATAPPAVVKLGSRRRAGVRCRAAGPVPAPNVAADLQLDLLSYRPRIRALGLHAYAPRAQRSTGMPRPAPDAEIAMPRSRRRKRHAQRLTIAGDSHETLGNRPLTRAERVDMARDLEGLAADGISLEMPRDDRECPLSTSDPCANMACRHHLYLEVDGDRTTLNWPGRNVDELEETCSLRAARKAAERRRRSGRPSDPAMSFAEVGRLMNLTAESVRMDLVRAIKKLGGSGGGLGD